VPPAQVVRFVALVVRAHRLLAAQRNLPVVFDQFNPLDRKARSFTAAQPQRLGVADSRALGGVQRIQIGPCFNVRPAPGRLPRWPQPSGSRGAEAGRRRQVLQISDPWLVAEVLDRRNYPHALDKPTSFPYNFYQGFNQARRPARAAPARPRAPAPAQRRPAAPRR